MALPFPISKRHKSDMRLKWEDRGMIFIDYDHYYYVYNAYIHETHCDLCNKLFLKTRDRHLDHDHNTGEPRNIVCCKCNNHRKDYKCTSSTGYLYITKQYEQHYATGYGYRVKINRNGVVICNKRTTTLVNAIKIRDEFINKNPDIHT
mgnify:CR=1 FL=1|tara:strand:- start:988 stop:1431 length:444 start_codon:yes stop_codon:yes gene_type:complete